MDSRGVPLSVTVADRIRKAIEDGEYPPGSRLPAEPALADQQKVSRPTLRESLRMLEREGRVVRRQRVGTVVTGRPAVRNSLQRNYGIQEMIANSGREYGVEDAELRFTKADQKTATALGIEAGAQVVVLERTMTAADWPVIVTIDYVDYDIIKGAKSPLPPDVAWYQWFHEQCGIEVNYGVASISVCAATEPIAGRLNLSTGSPLFRIEQIDYTPADRPVLYAIELHAPDAFDITVLRSGPFE